MKNYFFTSLSLLLIPLSGLSISMPTPGITGSLAAPTEVAACTDTASAPTPSTAAGPSYALYDTLEVLHNDLYLDIRRFDEAILQGRAEITVKSRLDHLAYAPLLLQGMYIDSVRVNGRDAGPIHYNDTLLRIPLVPSLHKGEEARLTVVYHGHPASASFGGFVFSDSLRHAHNMGISIHGLPPSFGRSWFPAIDDFRSRSTFDFHLRVDSDRQAIASGILQSIQAAPENTTIWHWKLRQPAPDYLVSVAVGAYEKITYPYTSLTGHPLPIDIYVFPEETEAARETYAFLPAALEILENAFGPYAFDRVGYVSVDRRGGAMEHIANISIPKNPRPTVGYRTLAIHELIHSWFGNRVTCRTAQDMWLNEGITNFGPELVLEKLYGPEEAARYVRQNQQAALLLAPAYEGYLPLACIPDVHTYGGTVYDKGAMVMHTLRHYLGDEKLLPALKAYAEAYTFRTASVSDFESFISSATQTDLADFFDLWVNQPGFVAFEIDSIRGTTDASGFKGTVYLQQKRCHAPAFGRNVRVPLTFYDADGEQSATSEALIDGEYAAVPVALPFPPAFGLVDPAYALCKASLYDACRLDTAGTYVSSPGQLKVEAPEALHAPTTLHLEYYRVAPDPVKNEIAGKKYRLCDTHYWRVSGRLPKEGALKGRFPVVEEGPEAAWLKSAEKAVQSAAICLMYRRDAAADWVPVAQLTWPEADEAGGASGTTSAATAAAKQKTKAATSHPHRRQTNRELVAPLLAGEYCLAVGK